ncbi:hypothetical protein GC163_16965 [bacterium]|nr:hypothetical protein [bacterium]
MRFAILTHDHPFLHWDLLLEAGPVCRTWRLLSSPEDVRPIVAEAIPDHRLKYLDYEGPVSGNRGAVTRWDGGKMVWLTSTSTYVHVIVQGTRWQGKLSLHAPDRQNHWILQR